MDLCPSSLHSVSAEDSSEFFHLSETCQLKHFSFFPSPWEFSVPDYKFESENVEA